MNQIAVENKEPRADVNSRENFEHLLGEIISYPERLAEITRMIEDTFGQQKAILVLDMSGFSRTTQQHGILSFLLMIHQMQLICRPCVEQCRGVVIKAEADNLFCLFENVADAIGASKEIISRLNTVNIILPAEKRLYVAIGIGYGTILNIANEDIFGDEVNLACKLGEEIARKGEVLLTSSAKAEIDGSEITTREGVISISGISLIYYYVE